MSMVKILKGCGLSFLCLLFSFPVVAQTSGPIDSRAPQPQYEQALPFEPVAAVTFYSHSFGENFPHAFVIIEQHDEQGRLFWDAFGFSAKHLTPKLLWGRVDGHIAVPGDRYIRQSDPHFIKLINAQQRDLIFAIRHQWSEGEGSRYHLNKHHCVHFIAELAQAAGLKTNPDSDHFKEPASFLREVMALNPELQGSLQRMTVSAEE